MVIPRPPFIFRLKLELSALLESSFFPQPMFGLKITLVATHMIARA